jgi:hypothetical protein
MAVWDWGDGAKNLKLIIWLAEFDFFCGRGREMILLPLGFMLGGAKTKAWEAEAVKKICDPYSVFPL